MNNSTFSPSLTNPNSRYKAAYAHRLNIEGFIQIYGPDHCGLLSLVFPRHVTWTQANANLEKAQRALIDPLFPAWICVVENHKDGRPHFHFLVACKENIRAGFDFVARDQAAEINRRACSQGRRMTSEEKTAHKGLIKSSLANAAVLRPLWDRLRKSLPHYGFGRIHPGTLEPIKSAPHLASYLVKSFGADALPRPREMKGARLVRYSQGQNRRAIQKFAWTGSKSKLQRQQVAHIAAALGVVEGQFASVYGPHWHRHCMNLVQALEYDFGVTTSAPTWPEDAIRQAAQTYLPKVTGGPGGQLGLSLPWGSLNPLRNRSPR